MCGIVGYIDIKGSMALPVFERMRDSLAHRGPDGCGLTLFDDQGCRTDDAGRAHCGLAHRRLSIIDLTEAGAQPMSNEDGTVWITYNGEFYNFQDYRKELETTGHVFRSHCDTETILHLYEEVGIEAALSRMNGMWGFGLYDAPRRRLILARDRIGKKPLYYAEVQGGLLFGSEIKALYASGLIDLDRLDEDAIADVLSFGTPLGSRTALAQIRMLPPGHYAVWERGRLTLHRYYTHPMERIEPENRRMEDFADELEELLADAIRIRLIADVPVGLFLSGGIDSSLMAALTQKRLQRDIHAYCISFDDVDHDESQHARRVAEHLGLSFHVMPAAAQGPDEYYKIARHVDQPLGDASLLPTFLVSQLARRSGVKVALTGDGGDELFGGYDFYRTGLRLWGNRAQRRALHVSKPLNEWLWERRIQCLGFERGYVELLNQFSTKHRLKIYTSPWRGYVNGRRANQRRCAILREARHRPCLDRMQYSDMRGWMVDVILRKVDMMSMANSLECRSPILDYRVVELAARLPADCKLRAGKRGKVILRHLLQRYVPAEIFERPKMGFCMPWDQICSGSYAESLKPRWRHMGAPGLRSDAGDWLFEETGVGGMFRKWSAFTLIAFFERLAELKSGSIPDRL